MPVNTQIESGRERKRERVIELSGNMKRTTVETEMNASSRRNKSNGKERNKMEMSEI